MPDHSYEVYRTPETVTVSIPCWLIEKLFTEVTSLSINLREAPDSTAVNLPRALSRAPSWSTMEEANPPSYQEVVEGGVESEQWTLRCPHLKMPMIPHMNHHMNQNIFSDNEDNNPRGIG